MQYSHTDLRNSFYLTTLYTTLILLHNYIISQVLDALESSDALVESQLDATWRADRRLALLNAASGSGLLLVGALIRKLVFKI